VACAQGEYARAAALLEEALAWFRLSTPLGNGTAETLNHLGNVAYLQGEHERAVGLLHDALRLSRDMGTREQMAHILEGLAGVAAACGQLQRAARLGGAAEALREVLGVPLAREWRVSHERAVQAMQAALGTEAFAAAWAGGRALPLEEAVALGEVVAEAVRTAGISGPGSGDGCGG
jgi:tetratricopeptide (TPR) repeat protein